MYKNSIIFLLFLFWVNLGHSQIINGIVHDSSKKPLSGVIITEKGTTNNAVSDKNGKYGIAITNLLDNKYVLAISQDGFYYTELSGFGYETKANIVLIRKDENLEEKWEKVPSDEKNEKKD